MMLTDADISVMRDDPVAGTLAVCEKILDSIESNNLGWEQQDYENMLEAYSLLVEVIDSKLLPIHIAYPKITGSSKNDYSQIVTFITEVKVRITAESSKLKVESMRNKFRLSLGSGFAYEFSQGDLNKVQHLLNELREQISSAHQLDKEHQQRLLRRLEKLQSELHKKVSDLDRFWGLIGDAGVVFGKLGTDAKPIVDRIREIADVVWQTQSRAEELPSGTTLPLLEHSLPRESESA